MPRFERLRLTPLWSKLVGEHTVGVSLTYDIPELPDCIEFYLNQNELKSRTIYITTSEGPFPGIDTHCEDGCSLFVSDCSEDIILDVPHNLSYLLFSCGVGELYNSLYSIQKKTSYEKNEFETFLSAVMLKKLTTNRTVAAAFSQLPEEVAAYVRPLIVCIDDEFEDPDYGGLMRSLRSAFPHTNIGRYGNYIVVMETSDVKKTRFSSEDQIYLRLTFLFEHYHAYALIGSSTRQFDALKDTLLSGVRMLQIAIQMNKGSDVRVFYREDYYGYYIMDGFMRFYLDVSGAEDPFIFINNNLVSVIRYDRNNGTKFVDVLYEYLMSERSLSATAEKMYIHKNTVLNYIKKIEKISSLAFDDPEVRMSLLSSIRYVRYLKAVWGREIPTSGPTN